MAEQNDARWALNGKLARKSSVLLRVCVSVAVFGCSSIDDASEGPVPVVDSVSTPLKLDGQGRNYTLFEAGPVRPVAVLDDGLVAVANVPDDRVEFFKPHGHGVKHCGSVKVGMRPVALSAVGDKLWVVNHLSDSVSVLNVDERRCSAEVERTLLVGDEPRDVVSAKGPNGERWAFVTVAHRGQNVVDTNGNPRDPELSRPGMGRADVFVYRANRLGPINAEKPATILTLFTDSPRALAVGKDKVYAAGFLSGNQTSLVRYQLVVDRGRQSLLALDADGDFQIDDSVPAEARVIEGGYPAIKGHGRCVSGALSTPNTPGADRNDFWMDVCVRTDPSEPNRALEIIPQNTGVVSPDCSCNNAIGEMQITPPLIVRFYASPSICGSNFSAELNGCWLEPPQNNAELPGPDATEPLLVGEWNDEVSLSLPDKDVFTIDLTQNPPVLVAGGDFRHVGTTLFNMAVHPKNGKVFVSNTEARNQVRFEGPGGGVEQDGGFASTTVRGHIAESRVTVLDPTNQSVKPVHLNAHIDFSSCCAPAPNDETENSLAFPVGMVMSKKRGWHGQLLDSQDLYVAALGSDKVAILNTSRLEQATPGQIVQDKRDHIEVRGGPVGLELDEERDRLYVLARFTNELVVVNTRSRRVVERARMFNPEPANIVEGRPFLYDARRTSSHGDSACASCHIFGDFDGLSWDLSAPDDRDVANLGPFFAKPEITSFPLVSRFLAVKGPMSTQSLRGMANHGSLHWRGDRRGGVDSTIHKQPDTGAFDEDAAFKAFNVAFAGLNGRATELTESDMQKFTDFALELTYPPNPIRRLDDMLTEGQKRARSRYFGCQITDESMALGECADGRNIDLETLNCNCANPPEFMLGLEPRPAYCPSNPVCTLDVSDFQNTCNGCHALDPDANEEFGVAKPGLFGSSGFYTNDGVAHVLKVPHLRNMYQKVGMFGSTQTRRGVGLTNLADSIFGPREGGLLAAQNAKTGDQIRGFGFTHAGEEDTVFHFFSSSGFARAPAPGFPLINDNRAGVETTLPRDTTACYDNQMKPLNVQFLAQLGTPQEVQAIRLQLQIFTNPASTPEQKAAAFQVIATFIGGLPESNPGSVFQRLPIQSAVGQFALPLLACPNLPPAAALESLGCFELKTGAACASLISTLRGCALWGATLEQIIPNGTKVCMSFGIQDKADMEDLMMAFDSNLKPIVGQQVTLVESSGLPARARLQLLIQQAEAGHCDLVAHTKDNGFVYLGGEFVRDDGEDYSLSRLDRHVISRMPVTFTAVPPREGRRSGIDRDEDGRLDRFDATHGEP
jgi:DNA-binding beta-propeller fold protein YncE